VELRRYAMVMKAVLTHPAAAQSVRAFGVVIAVYVVSTSFQINKSLSVKNGFATCCLIRLGSGRWSGNRINSSGVPRRRSWLRLSEHDRVLSSRDAP
jgi:hypothetical protein